MRGVEIELIRGVNPFPDELPPPPIEFVLRRLERASVTRRRVRMPSIGGIVVAASVLLTVAIAVGAFSLLRLHGRRDSALKPSGGGYPAVVRRVIANYAIFRRPQTAADRALPHRELPEHTLLVRHLTTRAGHAVFVALTTYHAHLTSWLITEQGRGAGESTFAPFPLRRSLPPLVEIGRRWVSFVPDSVTRVVWTDYGGDVVTTRPYHNVVYGPIPAYSYGATFYAGSRQLIAESVPVGELRLTSPDALRATGEAAISRTTGTGTSVQISAHDLLGRSRAYGVWLYSDAGHEDFLGLRVVTGLWPPHTLSGGAVLPDNYRSYRQLLITAQSSRKPAAPDEIVLEGNIPH